MTFDPHAVIALQDIYTVFGVEATFSPLVGDDVTLTVIIDTDNDWKPSGQVQIAEPQIMLDYRRSDIDRKVKRGETFTVGLAVYTVVSMAHYPNSWTEYEGRAVVT